MRLTLAFLAVLAIAIPAAAQPNTPDPRDAELAQLRAEIKMLRGTVARQTKQIRELKGALAGTGPKGSKDPAPPAADKLTPDEERALTRGIARAAVTIEECRRKLQSAQRGKVNRAIRETHATFTTTIYPSRSAKHKAVANAQRDLKAEAAHLAKLEARGPAAMRELLTRPTWIYAPIEVGMIGRLDRIRPAGGSPLNVRLFQIAGPMDALAYVFARVEKLHPDPRSYRHIDHKRTLVWLSRVSTKGRADDQALLIKGHFKVTGTKRYKTTTGSKTVFVLEPQRPDNPEPAKIEK